MRTPRQIITWSWVRVSLHCPLPFSPYAVRAPALQSLPTLTLPLRSVAWKPLDRLPLQGDRSSAACWIRRTVAVPVDADLKESPPARVSSTLIVHTRREGRMFVLPYEESSVGNVVFSDPFELSPDDC